ncbi:energy-coupling factor transporter ATPase [Herbivorax sp. ANBcel31]|uniref:energy-coupling factor transporter ATPase n=1 Tax=Herbivorax sp. ANBcel31 TaxID=3069754 RepID=UPI0027B75093|nr:energy-coupling factor transporter ATPase [Herbivorax sp. ANBcel31]MDQ2087612.1 energy-coupling factor transporter ATPase [Herbivorax sp. ANBcel31]
MDNMFIQIENAKYEYKPNKPAIHNVNVKIDKGEFISVIGRNGSGKSTFAKLLNAILFPTKGSVYINGAKTTDESQLWEIRQSIGMVFQNPDNQIVATSVEEDVAFGPENLGLSRKEIVKRVKKALEDVQLQKYSEVCIQNLSQGEKQKVAIAGVLAMKPECIVLDEATSMLDPLGRNDVISIIKKLNREEGITIIHITHHMQEAIWADRILLFNRGKIQMDGKPQDILTKVDDIKKAGLDVPQITQLFYELAQEGYIKTQNVLTIEDGIKAFKKILCS